MVIGEFNEPSSTQGSYLVVGDGTGKNELAHNILVVKKGRVNINGSLNINGSTGSSVTINAPINSDITLVNSSICFDDNNGPTIYGSSSSKYLSLTSPNGSINLNISQEQADPNIRLSSKGTDITGNTSISGNLTISNGVTIGGDLTASNDVTINGNLTVGSNTINSSNESITLTMPSQEGTLALNTEYYLYTITLCFYADTAPTSASGIFTFTGISPTALSYFEATDGITTYPSLTTNQLSQIYNMFSYGSSSIQFTASGTLKLLESSSSAWSTYDITAIIYRYNKQEGATPPTATCAISYITAGVSTSPSVNEYTLYSNTGGGQNFYIDAEHVHNVIVSKKTVRSSGGTIVNN